ncbi:GNAT family N-acetyltransferase [soil metagenome]
MVELNFEPFPNLQTGRLVLRKVSMDDAEALFELRTNDDAMKYINKTKPQSIAEVYELLEKMTDVSARIQWAVTLKQEPKLIGTIGYHIIDRVHYRAEIGYMLHPAHWNKGLMSEAISSVIDFGFKQMGLHSIEARINPENMQSGNILKKHAFIKEGYFKESYFYNDAFYDSEIYSLLGNAGKKI